MFLLNLSDLEVLGFCCWVSLFGNIAKGSEPDCSISSLGSSFGVPGAIFYFVRACKSAVLSNGIPWSGIATTGFIAACSTAR